MTPDLNKWTPFFDFVFETLLGQNCNHEINKYIKIINYNYKNN